MLRSFCLAVCLLVPSLASAGIIDDMNLGDEWEVRHWSLSGAYPTDYSLSQPWMQFTSSESWLGGKEFKAEITSLNLKNSNWYNCLPLIDNYEEGTLSFPQTILDTTFTQWVPGVGNRPTNVDEWFDSAGHFAFRVEDTRNFGGIWSAMDASGTYAVRMHDPPQVAEPASWLLLSMGVLGVGLYYAGSFPWPLFRKRKVATV